MGKIRSQIKETKYQIEKISSKVIIHDSSIPFLTWLIVLMLYALLTPLTSNWTSGHIHDGPQWHRAKGEERSDGEIARNGEGVEGSDQSVHRLNKYIDHSAYYCYSTVNKDYSIPIPINIHWNWSNYYLSPFHADLWQINRVIYLIYFQLLAKSESMTDQVN